MVTNEVPFLALSPALYVDPPLDTTALGEACLQAPSSVLSAGSGGHCDPWWSVAGHSGWSSETPTLISSLCCGLHFPLLTGPLSGETPDHARSTKPPGCWDANEQDWLRRVLRVSRAPSPILTSASLEFLKCKLP